MKNSTALRIQKIAFSTTPKVLGECRGVVKILIFAEPLPPEGVASAGGFASRVFAPRA